MVADKAREYYDNQAKERQKDHGGTAPERTLVENLPRVIQERPAMPAKAGGPQSRRRIGAWR